MTVKRTDMQTIKVTVKTEGSKTAFMIDKKVIGTINPGSNKPGVWVWCRDGNVPGSGFGFVGSYAAAVEALGDSITRHLGSVGLNVEFVNA